MYKSNKDKTTSGMEDSKPYQRKPSHQKSESTDNNNFKSKEANCRARSSSFRKKLFGKIEVDGIFDSSEACVLESLLIFRATVCLIWTAAIFYATYHVYLACEIYLGQKFRDPELNPGMFAGIFKRGKESSYDYEWEMFTALYLFKLWIWNGAFIVLSGIVQPSYYQKWKYLSFALTVAMFGDLMGVVPTLLLLLLPTIYWVIGRSQSKLLMWTWTVIVIYFLNARLIERFVSNDPFTEYFFVVASAWNCCRCISFCCDVWNQIGSSGKMGFKHLESLLMFCFYLPLAVSGPLVTYESFEINILNKSMTVLSKRDRISDLKKLLKKLFRIGVLALFLNSVFYFLYFRSLSFSFSVHGKISLWAICGTIYWLGQFFSMKYKVLYGLPSCIAEFDGLEMPPVPRCPSYLHRYSALWRDFDRGLYRFLVNYIYVPTLHWIQQVPNKKNIVPLDIVKLMASFMTFVFVYIWHSLSFEVFVWSSLNFIGISIERFGSVLKREIDRRNPIQPLVWDFIIEPIVTVPLAAMSILNSAIFCGSLDIARSFGYQIWTRWGDSWIFLFLYFFTHTAVTHRTWERKLSQLFSRIVYGKKRPEESEN